MGAAGLCLWVVTPSEIAIRRPVSRPPGAVLPEHSQTFAVKVEIDECEVGAQPVMVLGDAPIAHFIDAEDPLQDAEGVLDFGSYSGFRRVLLFCNFIHIVLELRSLEGCVSEQVADWREHQNEADCQQTDAGGDRPTAHLTATPCDVQAKPTD
jgi:hypothetical protein